MRGSGYRGRLGLEFPFRESPARPLLKEDFEGGAGAVGVGKEAVGGREVIGGEVGEEEPALSGEGNGLDSEGLTPGNEIVEIDVGGEIAPAGEGVEFGADKAFVVGVGAQGAGRSAVVDLSWRSAVVDGEELAGGPAGEPGSEPMAVTFVNLQSLTRRPGFLEEGGDGKPVAAAPVFGDLSILQDEVEFLPLVVPAKDAHREGVHEFVREDGGASPCGLESILKSAMPPDGSSEELALLGLQSRRAFDDMVGQAPAKGIGEPPTTQRMAAQGLQYCAGKLSRARSDLNEVSGFTFEDPCRQRTTQSVGEGSAGGKVSPAADRNARVIVTVPVVIEGELHEAVKAEAVLRSGEMGIEPVVQCSVSVQPEKKSGS